MKAKRVTVVGYPGSLLKGKRPMLAERVVVGEKPCPGEAHGEYGAYFDHCAVCLNHRWGFVPEYAPVSVLEETSRGKVVPVACETKETREEMAKLEAIGAVEMVEVKEKRSGATSYYMAWTKGGV